MQPEVVKVLNKYINSRLLQPMNARSVLEVHHMHNVIKTLIRCLSRSAIYSIRGTPFKGFSLGLSQAKLKRVYNFKAVSALLV